MPRLSLVLGVLWAGCAGTIERVEPPNVEAGSHAESLATTIEQVAAGFSNLGRLGAVQERASQLGLGDRMRTEWIDWFSVLQNVMIELPGRTPKLVYVVAHYDKVDLTPLTAVSVFLNGLLDPLIAPTFSSAGAIDNGTGVAVALEVGAALARRPHEYTYRILLVGGEEMGLRGSRAHVARLSRAEKDAIGLAVVIDTAGVRYGENCLMDVSDPTYSRYARNAATSLGFPLGVEKLPAGASSDFEPFQKTSFWSDVARGLKFNLIGGLLPQRSWFTGAHAGPVVFFSSCNLLGVFDFIGGAVLLPLGRLHGPRDRLSEVDGTRLYQQYEITLRMLEDLEKDQAFGS